MKLAPYHFFAHDTWTLHVFDSHSDVSYCGMRLKDLMPGAVADELCEECLKHYRLSAEGPKEE